MPRPGRAYWKGFLRLSLVSIPVEIYSAVDTSVEIQLNQIHKPSGKRVNYTKTVKGIGPIDTADIVKGYEVDKDVYVTLDPEELDALKIESKKTIDLQQFIDVAEIDPRYFEKPYYLVPADEHAAEGYLVIREALREMNKLGVGQVTMSGREHIVAVGPVEDGLIMEVLRYGNEIRSSKPYFSDLPDMVPDKEMIALARELISRKAAPFDPDIFEDSYAAAIKELVAKKAKGQRINVKPSLEVPQDNVINILDALRSSLKASEEPKAVKVSKKTPDKKNPRPPKRAAS